MVVAGEGHIQIMMRNSKIQTGLPPRSRSPGMGDPHWVLEVVYDDPLDALQPAPPRRFTPLRKGDTIGDALFFGDEVLGGCAERLRGRLRDAGLRMVADVMPGRTTRWDVDRDADDDEEEDEDDDDTPELLAHLSNGMFEFSTTFSSHLPLWVILSLGVNDLRKASREAMRKALAKGFSFEDPLARRRRLPRGEDDEEEDDDNNEDEDDNDDEDDEEDNLTLEPRTVNGAGGFADLIARSVTSIVAKAKLLFTGHCHDGVLTVIVLAPPVLETLTPSLQDQGFDDMSVQISKKLTAALTDQGQTHGFRVLVPPKEVDPRRWKSGGVTPNPADTQRLADALFACMEDELPGKPNSWAQPPPPPTASSSTPTPTPTTKRVKTDSTPDKRRRR